MSGYWDYMDVYIDAFPVFTRDEMDRIRKFKIPGDAPNANYGTAIYPKKPKENVREWYKNHEEKLRSIMRDFK